MYMETLRSEIAWRGNTHPGKPIFLLSYGNEFGYRNAFIIPVRRIGVVECITVTQQKNRFCRIHTDVVPGWLSSPS